MAIETIAETANAKILVIDDDEQLTSLLSNYLQENENFDLSAASSGEEGLRLMDSEPFDMVILDVMLPGITGVEVLRKIRATSQVPVLMLTAKFEEVDRVVGLEMGADDYLGKPFNPRELLARMHAIMRRARPQPPGPASVRKPRKLRVGDVTVDLGTRSVSRGGALIDFTTAEFDLLETLLQSAGQVVSREEISEKAFSRQLMPLDRSIDMHICQLRKKLGPPPRASRLSERIKTVRAVGYMYCCTAEDLEQENERGTRFCFT